MGRCLSAIRAGQGSRPSTSATWPRSGSSTRWSCSTRAVRVARTGPGTGAHTRSMTTWPISRSSGRTWARSGCSSSATRTEAWWRRRTRRAIPGGCGASSWRRRWPASVRGSRPRCAKAWTSGPVSRGRRTRSPPSRKNRQGNSRPTRSWPSSSSGSGLCTSLISDRRRRATSTR